MKMKKLCRTAAALLLTLSLLPAHIPAEELLGDGSSSSGAPSLPGEEAWELPVIPMEGDPALPEVSQEEEIPEELPSVPPEDGQDETSAPLPEEALLQAPEAEAPADSLLDDGITDGLSGASPEQPSRDALFDGGLSSGAADMVGAPTSGYCGANVKWSYASGTLSLTGTGKMNDYDPENESSDSRPWAPYLSSITKVTMANGITNVGSCAFFGCKKLSSVTLSTGITSIGFEAFRGTAITGFTVPSKTTKIGFYAFGDCTSLKTFQMGNNVTSIESGMLYGCSALTSATLSSKVTSLPYRCFSGCRKLSSLSALNQVRYIHDYAFKDCASLTSVSLGYLEYIGREAFSGSGLTSAIIPSGVETIGPFAFHNCKKLTNVKMPVGADLTLGAGAFAGCTALKEISVPGNILEIGANAFNGCTSLSKVSLGNGITAIEYSAFYNCTSLKAVELPYSVASVGPGAFDSCTSLEVLRFLGTLPAVPALSASVDNWKDTSLVPLNPNLSASYRRIFTGVTGAGFYNKYQASWTASGRKALGGSITWVAWDPGADVSVDVCTRKMTFSQDGIIRRISSWSYLENGKEPVQISIPHPVTVTLSSADFLYNGKNRLPEVIMTDAYGKAIPTSLYTVSFPEESKYPGVYTITITLKGNASGTKALSFRVNKGKTVIALPDEKTIRFDKTKSFLLNASVSSGNKSAKLSYNSSNTKTASVDAAGKVTVKSVGRTTITVMAPESANYAAVSKAMVLTVLPQSSVLDRVYDKGNGSWRAIIRAVPGIDNYQLMWSTTSDFKSYKTASLKPGTHSYTRKDLIPGKTYYVKVRTCKVVDGVKFYSYWSGVKSVKVS